MAVCPETLIPRRASLGLFILGHRHTISPKIFVVGMVCVILGCGRSKQPQPKNSTPSPSSVTESAEKPTATESSREDQKEDNKQTPPAKNDVSRADTPMASGKTPGPDNVCGHAVAFAGWRLGGDAPSNSLLYFDPADNAFEVGRHQHRWQADPAKSPVHFGARRPTVVLEPGKPFTVCGAVVVFPQGDAVLGEPVNFALDSMPDLSQVLGDQWPGLCGPTSAADIIFCLGSHRDRIAKGLLRGPSANADKAVSQLIIGHNNTIEENSLAFRMGLQDDGRGVTNAGMKRGLGDWLEHHDPGSWKVELNWFDDEEKTVDAQSSFFRELESVNRTGGGAILCLWPGTEFSDGSTAEAAQRNASAAVRSENGQANGSGAGASSSNDGRSAASADDESASQQRKARNKAAPSQSAGGDGSDAGDTAVPLDKDQSASETAVASITEQPGGTQAAIRGGMEILSGKKASPEEVQAALKKGRKDIDAAKKAVQKGDTAGALQHLGAALSTLRRHAATSDECRTALQEATEMAVALSQGEPDAPPMTNTTTTFE